MFKIDTICISRRGIRIKTDLILLFIYLFIYYKVYGLSRSVHNYTGIYVKNKQKYNQIVLRLAEKTK